MKIFLSPSRQGNNMYYGKYNNKSEKQVMEDLSISLGINLLKFKDVEVKIATTSLKIQQRVVEAKNWGADLYIALHSNASGTSPSTARGAVVLMHESQGAKLPTEIIDSLNTATPHGQNRWDQKVITTSTYEVIEPYGQGMLPLYIEVDFHDNPVTASYIVENISKIAKAIATGLYNFYYWDLIPALSDPEPAKEFYRVQVGAFNDRQNAEKLNQELIKLGYNPFIVTVKR